MNKLFLPVLCCLLVLSSFSQQGKDSSVFNAGFEMQQANQALPDGWFVMGSGYLIKTDSVIKNSGKLSIRIEPGINTSHPAFGGIGYAIPADYEGKEIELRAYMKLQNVTGPIGLMLRIDGPGGVLGFDNMQKKNIRGTADWTVYSVKLPFPKNARNIAIGALLSGKGQLWVDDFQILIDGKDLKDASFKKRILSKADMDHAFDKGSGITAITLSKEKIEDLVLLGQTWGFLKYYHPAVTAYGYNWDYELFRILPKIILAKTSPERNNILTGWIDSLGKTNPAKEKKNTGNLIKMQPDLAWVNDSVTGTVLSQRLQTIQHAKRTEESHYISLQQNAGNPDFSNELPYTNMHYPDAGFRLLCLYRYWNIIQYFFPYKNLIAENWNDVLKEYIPLFLTAANELEYKKTVLALIARIHDTHASIWSREPVLDTFRGLRYAPVEISFIENKPVVTGYYDSLLAQKSGLKKGDIIENVNNRPVAGMIAAILPLSPASNYPTQLRNIAPNLLRTNDSSLFITYRRGDSLLNSPVNSYPASQINLYGKYQKQDTCFKMLAPDIGWLYPGYIKNTYLPGIMPELLKTKGLVIDFRCYPSDFVVFSLGEYLFPEKTAFVKFSNGSIVNPGLFTIVPTISVGKKNNNYYKGKIVIIVNETTQSSAEYHTMAFRAAPGAVVIGSTTAGADGNVSQLILPGGIMTMISGIGVYYPDGRETQRVGIVPNLEIRPTIQGTREGKDELLQKAIDIINGN